MNQQLLDFYKGTAPDIRGRFIDDIWRWDYDRLEKVHDYIQWLFPSGRASQFNANAPLLDEETIAAFRADADLQGRLLRSLQVMLPFYGLALTGGSDSAPSVARADNYEERRANWQEAPAGYLNHNLLRLTRIIEALRVLGLATHGVALCRCLESIQQEEPESIPEKTAAFWRQAAGLS